MKNGRKGKISRHKVPNLNTLAENSNKAKIVWPAFFSKIENSLKLLQEPISFDLDDNKKVKNKASRTLISLRLTELARHKERFTSLNSSELDKSYGVQSGRENGIFLKRKPLSLPRMHSKYEDSRITNVKKEGGRIYETDQNKVQQIASSKFIAKTYSEILKQLEQQSQQKPKNKKSSENTEECSEADHRQKQADNSNEPELVQNFLTLEGNYTELSERIVRDLHHKYDSYDRKLMEKIKIYRPKKYHFTHQLAWK